jgi:hypothetical protein
MSAHVGNHLRVLQSSERTLADSLHAVARRHADQPDVPPIANMLAQWSQHHAELLEPIAKRYAGAPAASPRLLAAVLFKGPRRGAIGLLRDLADLAILAHAVAGSWTAIDQAAAALRDDELKALCDAYIAENKRQIEWLDTRMKELAPQALTVP